MLIDAFKPTHLQTIAIAVTGTSQLVIIPGSGEFLSVTNAGASGIIFIETSPAAGAISPDPSTAVIPLAATNAGSMPVLPGQTRIIRRHVANNESFLSAIGSVAGPTALYVTPGFGT